MKPIKTQQRYRCDFCKRTSIKSAMLAHEKICFRNPNRYCDNCKNKGYTIEDYGEGMIDKQPCFFCSKFDPKQLKEIEERESKFINLKGLS